MGYKNVSSSKTHLFMKGTLLSRGRPLYSTL